MNTVALIVEPKMADLRVTESEITAEIAKLVVSAITPILVAGIGWGLLREIERIKSKESRRSALYQKQADQFFDSCQDFMSAIEKYLSAQASMQSLANFHSVLKEQLRIHTPTTCAMAELVEKRRTT